MKTFFSLLLLVTFSFGSANAQSIKDIFNSITKNKGNTNSSNIAAGLKEALQVGTERSVQKLSVLDGFFANAMIKILMPDEAKKVEQKLRAIGFGNMVDNAILSMNRAAEDAAKSAAPIFINAIKQMTIQDAVGILRGNDFAATDFLKSKTSAALTNAFRPVIEASLQKVNATKYWNTIFTTYNKLSFNKINPDLSAYVTDKALSGIFYQVGLEEQKIRKDPAARTTELLKQVFGSK
ncbi:MAG TPA: DUF4197 domain-containing protein [Chitinophagaceae bacterium]